MIIIVVVVAGCASVDCSKLFCFVSFCALCIVHRTLAVDFFVVVAAVSFCVSYFLCQFFIRKLCAESMLRNVHWKRVINNCFRLNETRIQHWKKNINKLAIIESAVELSPSTPQVERVCLDVLTHIGTTSKFVDIANAWLRSEQHRTVCRNVVESAWLVDASLTNFSFSFFFVRINTAAILCIR